MEEPMSEDVKANKKELIERAKAQKKKLNQQRLSVWASPEDRKKIEAKAAALGLPVSQFLRTLALNAGADIGPDEKSEVRAARKQVGLTYAALTDMTHTINNILKRDPNIVDKKVARATMQLVEKRLIELSKQITSKN
jgi:uncharacterized protein (DUF1778 family)